jgi:2-keto-4-pentenoate hydratase/2-oxohepta-3-ene-1,7-dioic acid hydratase in catechol pathway
MRRALVTALVAILPCTAHAEDHAAPFKLGSFEKDGRHFVGVVLKETLVVDLAAAEAARPSGPASAAPADMKDLIARYHDGLRERIAELAERAAAAASRPAYVHELASLRTLPPILYPTTMLNVAVNYREHGVEMMGREAASIGSVQGSAGALPPGAAAPGTKAIPGIWDREADDPRWNPYMFVKLPSAVIGAGEAIRIPRGRTQIDWECELGVVIGRTARRVAPERAAAHIFGYTLENDVSDRAGRGDGRHGSDWLIGKSHDSFAPMGPFVVPSEFVKNPQKLRVRFTLNGQLMQDSSTAAMIHDVYELVSYASHITTLRPGDVIATGTPPGVGSGRTPPVFLKAGDVASCSYEGVGTLTNPVAAE